MFLWQIPHFMAIAWLYRDDYGKAGFPMLPVVDPGGARAGRQAVVHAATLVAGRARARARRRQRHDLRDDRAGDGCVLLALAIRFAVTRSDRSARALFLGSITYLPLLWIAMIEDKL